MLENCRRNLYPRAVLPTIVIGTILAPDVAYAYVDPGIAYAALQGALAFLFGAGVAWVMRPWRYFMRLIGRDRTDNAEQRELPDSTAAPKGDEK